MKAEEFNKQAVQEIEIPGFESNTVITIKVQRPRLLAMAEEGSIPNPLMGAVESVLVGAKKEEKPDIKNLAEIVTLYCRVCMVDPKFEDVKDSMTDDQMFAIWSWVGGRANKLNTFRKEQKNGSDSNSSKPIQAKTKPNNGNRR